MALARALEKMDYKVIQAENGEKGVKIVDSEEIHLVLCDIKLPGMNGMEVLEYIKQSHPHIIVVMMTAFGSIEKAVKAIKLGAMDFLEKPLDLEIVRNLVNSALKPSASPLNRKILLEETRQATIFQGMVGTGPSMHDIFDTIIKVAPSRATVLITGETGTGKELVARALHNLSHRDGPFVAVNLSSLTDTLIESELFGYVKGAHSTAFKDRKGRLGESDKGTFFMDEVGDIPKQIQVKLLRVIEQRTFERLGENIPNKIDTRFIAATHVNMEEAVAEGRFRQDLYYRLKVIEINLPPLRERREDIPLLVQTYINRYSEENAIAPPKISQDTMDLLYNFEWPGNVRELERAIERAVILSEGEEELIPRHFSDEIRKH